MAEGSDVTSQVRTSTMLLLVVHEEVRVSGDLRYIHSFQTFANQSIDSEVGREAHDCIERKPSDLKSLL